MALNKQTLKTNLLSLFVSMGSNSDNQAFASGLATILMNYVNSASVSTSDGGTVPAGVFAGSGSGTVACTSETCEDKILEVCNDMNDSEVETDDDYFAEGLGEAIEALADTAVIITSVTGYTQVGSTQVYTEGVAEGNGLSISTSSLVSALKDCFAEMWDKRSDEPNTGNEDFATVLSDEVHACFTASGTVSTSGVLNLEGSSGSGKLS